MLTIPANVAKKDHCFNKGHSFQMSNVNIIKSTAKLLDFEILESININTNSSKIYNNQTATTVVNVLEITYVLLTIRI